MDKDINLTLSEMANGAIQEKLDGELEKVFDNIHDLNTKATAKRTLTIKLDLIPDDARQVVSMNSDFTVKLAPVEGVTTTILTGKDISTGLIEARELKSGRSGQGYIDIDTGQVKTDVGELVDVVEKEVQKQNKIIDLQNRA